MTARSKPPKRNQRSGSVKPAKLMPAPPIVGNMKGPGAALRPGRQMGGVLDVMNKHDDLFNEIFESSTPSKRSLNKLEDSFGDMQSYWGDHFSGGRSGAERSANFIRGSKGSGQWGSTSKSGNSKNVKGFGGRVKNIARNLTDVSNQFPKGSSERQGILDFSNDLLATRNIK